MAAIRAITRCRTRSPRPGPPHIAIPTTAGTGSEVTRFTVIIDSEKNEKMLIAGGPLLPSAAVVDYELSMTMPHALTADTGTDSLTHAIEAYVSRKANPFTDTLALAAMKIIWDELADRVQRARESHGARKDDDGRDHGRTSRSPTPASRWFTA